MAAEVTGASLVPGPRIVVDEVAIELLRPDPLNPRRIDPAVLDALTSSVVTHDIVQPILARRANGMIIAGHQRVVAARRSGRRTVPVIYLDIDEPRARALGLALNKISGTWDETLLARLLAELEATPGVDIRDTGFEAGEIRDLLRSLETREKRERPELFDLDEALAAATRAPRTQPGDRWLLGEHVLACGDATRTADVEHLLAGRRAAMAFTDPPYNVDLGGHDAPRSGSRRRRIRNDHLDPAAWETFVRAWVATLLGATDGAIYCAMSSKEWPTVARLLAEAGGHRSATIIWVKDHHVLGRADLHPQFEPVWYGWREGSRHWCGDRTQADVWMIDRPTASPLHPVMKPLALVERAITNSCGPGDLVLDPFLGSGTTLIACERTGRLGAGMELDPWYCDVAIARWEVFTGGAARLDSRLAEPPTGPETGRVTHHGETPS